MSKRAEYIQLSTGEDVPSVRDRLSFIRGRRVLLIWPEVGTALTRKLDLVLVQREAKRRAIQLALVTHDPKIIEHAQELGISAFETVGESERNRWKRGRTRVFTFRHHKPEDEPEPEALMEVASRVRGRESVPRWRLFIERLILLLVTLAAIAGISYLVLPSATVTLSLARQALQAETSITARPNLSEVDVENRLVPASVLRATVQTNGTIPTTGSQALGDLPSIGVVVFTNRTNEAVEIPENTTVSTSAGTPILFKTIAPATLPAGIDQRVDVGIQAMDASLGGIGNVEAGMINAIVGPLDARASVINLVPTTGGESRTFAAVALDDRERLLGIVRAQLQALAYSEMQASLSDSQLIVIETIRITEERNDWTEFSHAVGEVSDTLSLTMRAVVEASVIDDRFGRQILFAQLSAQKPPNLALRADTFNYERLSVTDIAPDGSVTFGARGQVNAVGEVNVERLRERLAGQDLASAGLLIVQDANIAPDIAPDIRISPAWLSHMPLLAWRIDLQFAEATGTP